MSGKRELYREKFGEFFDSLTNFIYTQDPAALVNCGVPANEYDTEAIAILRECANKKYSSIASLQTKVHEIFHSYFPYDTGPVSDECYYNIAKYLLDNESLWNIGNMQNTELHSAYTWDCDGCGEENVVRAIVGHIDFERLEDYKLPGHETDSYLAGPPNGVCSEELECEYLAQRIVMFPSVVTCKHCGCQYNAKVASEENA